MKWYAYQVENDDYTVSIYGMHDDEHGAKCHAMAIMNAFIDDIDGEFGWRIESDAKNNRIKLFRSDKIDDDDGPYSLLRYVGWASH